MEEVKFDNFNKGKTKKSWNYRREYPSVLNFTESDKKHITEIWISEERLKVPVGKKKVVIRFFLWLKYNKQNKTYDCSLGIVPDYKMLDDKASEILKSIVKDFYKKPYYHLLNLSEYRDVFLIQRDVEEELINDIRNEMEIATSVVERNLIYYLEGGQGKSTVESSNGWAVLLRARSGSL